MTASISGEFQERLERLDKLLTETGRSSDPAVEARIREIAQLILNLHGMGLERMLEIVAESASLMLESFAADPVVSGLLMLHGLHPLDLESRVAQALEGVKPYLQAHGGSIELIELSDGIVRLRFHGSCDGCPSSALTMKQTIERAIQEAAPDVAGIELVGIGRDETSRENGHARLALPVLQ